MEKLSCLIIDDDLEEIDIFRMALESFPYVQLDYFTNSPTALEHLSKSCSQPAFIFIDQNMPIIRGKDLIRQIRTLPHLLATSVYTYTTSSLQNDKTEALEAGATGFVTKPPDLSSLREILQTIFKKQV